MRLSKKNRSGITFVVVDVSGGCPSSRGTNQRTIVDSSFLHLDKETALKGLQAYLKTSKDKKPDIDKLPRYAKKFRVDITPYISAFTL